MTYASRYLRIYFPKCTHRTTRPRDFAVALELATCLRRTKRLLLDGDLDYENHRPEMLDECRTQLCGFKRKVSRLRNKQLSGSWKGIFDLIDYFFKPSSYL